MQPLAVTSLNAAAMEVCSGLRRLCHKYMLHRCYGHTGHALMGHAPSVGQSSDEAVCCCAVGVFETGAKEPRAEACAQTAHGHDCTGSRVLRTGGLQAYSTVDTLCLAWPVSCGAVHNKCASG